MTKEKETLEAVEVVTAPAESVQEKPSQELAKVEKPEAVVLAAEPGSPEALISLAIQTGANVDTLERLMAMRDKLKAEQAKKDFDDAMVVFQAEIPTIQKTKIVKTNSGVIAYKYAPLESIVEQVKKHLADNGFSYSTEIERTAAGVKATCIAKHVGGHQERSSLEVPFGNKTQVMSDTQVTAAAGTFAKRYAFCNVFGIMTGDEDTDGADPAGSDRAQPRAQYTPPARPAAPARPVAPVRTAAGGVNPAMDNFIANQNKQQPAPAQSQLGATGKPWDKWAPKNKPAQPTGSLCSRCGKQITAAESGYSQRRFKKELCRDCQGVEQNH